MKALVFVVLVAFLICVNCKSQQSLDAYAQDCELITEKQMMIAHRCNCSNFIICSVNPPVLMSCPVGLRFNQEIQVCDYKFNVKCVPETGCPPS
ncbi:peritrophin-1-like [Bombus fervidus]|uniref:peritrophin-1-like n=1 Tax=Bombus fervidus TaxID=203811 RepID=UPI003D188BC1